jgi:hypothetical protein
MFQKGSPFAAVEAAGSASDITISIALHKGDERLDDRSWLRVLKKYFESSETQD